MVKHTQTIRWQIADELFVFDHFVGLALKELRLNFTISRMHLVASHSLAGSWHD